jgi:hypothetical protein
LTVNIARRRLDPPQRGEMSARQVDDVDVIAHARAIGRRPVGTEHAELRAPPHRHLGDERHQVVGHVVGVLADQPAGMRPHRIEVAQVADRPACVGLREVGQQHLDEPLAAAVRIRRPRARALPDRHRLRIAVDRGRGAEHEAAHVGPRQRLQQHLRSGDVVVVVLERPGNRLPDGLQPGEVQHGTDVVTLQEIVEQRGVTHVALHERHRQAGDPLHPAQRLGAGIAEVVEHHDRTSVLEQLDHGVRTDVSRSAGDQHRPSCRSCHRASI